MTEWNSLYNNLFDNRNENPQKKSFIKTMEAYLVCQHLIIPKNKAINCIAEKMFWKPKVLVEPKGAEITIQLAQKVTKKPAGKKLWISKIDLFIQINNK